MTKKQTIINSAIELFAVQGIEATSVQQITQHCGISKGAFYLSFKSKDELILAIIEYFIKNVVFKVDQVVRETENPQRKLELYFEKTLEIVSMYVGFGETLLMESVHSLNEQVLEKISFYDQQTDATILHILDACFGDTVASIKYDLLIVMKGFVSVYIQQLMPLKIPIDNIRLSKSLAEKTTILAQHMQLPYATKQLSKSRTETKPTADMIVAEIDTCLETSLDPVLMDSLVILKEQLGQPQPRMALINGMLANLQHCEDCQWCCLLIKAYYEIE